MNFLLCAKLFHFILRSYILTQHNWKVLHDLIFSREQHYADVQNFPKSGKGWVGKSSPVGGWNRKFYWGDFFTGWREPEEAWFWRFEPFSKLKTAFCESCTSIKIKIGMACVSKEYELKRKMEQEQWIQLEMLHLFGYNLKIVV